MAAVGRIVRVRSAEDTTRVRDLVAAVAGAGRRGLSEHKRLELARGGADAWIGLVALDGGGEAQAYAHVSRHVSAASRSWGLELTGATDVAVGAAAERLVCAALDAVAAEGGGTIQWWVADPSHHDDELAARLGGTSHRDLLRMDVPLGPPGVGAASSRPAGLTLRAFRPGADEGAWLVANQRAFAEHPEQGGWDGAALAMRVGEPWFDPRGFLVAELDAGSGDDGGTRLAGFCWTKQHDQGVGEIYVIGVDPDHQGIGLGRVLVEAGLASLAERGSSVGMLFVDASNAAAIGLYRALGFAVVSTQRAYRIEVTRPSA